MGVALLIAGRRALIAEHDAYTTVEVSGSLRRAEGGVIENDAAGKISRSGLNRQWCRSRRTPLQAATPRQSTNGRAALETLAMHLALTAHRHLHPFTQGITTDTPTPCRPPDTL